MMLMSVSPFCTVSHVIAANGGDGGMESVTPDEEEEEDERGCRGVKASG